MLNPERETTTSKAGIFSSKPLNLKSLGADIFFFRKLTTSPLFLKFLLASEFSPNSADGSFCFLASMRKKLSLTLAHQYKASLFSDRPAISKFSNVEFGFKSNFTLRRLVKTRFDNKNFDANVILLYTNTLNDFVENVTGRKALMHLNTDIERGLTSWDRGRMFLWDGRVYGFRRMLGPKIFVIEGLQLMILSLRLKDPTFLANWIRGMLKRLSF